MTRFAMEKSQPLAASDHDARVTGTARDSEPGPGPASARRAARRPPQAAVPAGPGSDRLAAAIVLQVPNLLPAVRVGLGGSDTH